MREVVVSVPDEAALALKIEPEDMAAELRLLAAIKLYELGRLSSGAAAALAGIPRTVLLGKLADYGVPTFCLGEEDLAQDLANA